MIETKEHLPEAVTEAIEQLYYDGKTTEEIIEICNLTLPRVRTLVDLYSRGNSYSYISTQMEMPVCLVKYLIDKYLNNVTLPEIVKLYYLTGSLVTYKIYLYRQKCKTVTGSTPEPRKKGKSVDKETECIVEKAKTESVVLTDEVIANNGAIHTEAQEVVAPKRKRGRPPKRTETVSDLSKVGVGPVLVNEKDEEVSNEAIEEATEEFVKAEESTTENGTAKENDVFAVQNVMVGTAVKDALLALCTRKAELVKELQRTETAITSLEEYLKHIGKEV